ncbi:MAG TPA: SDR family NAD(P)-dependent oxidoreductase, partial [Solirubrobacterales bacterium]|nr:SDR family NAD(P)-dependent oxidoreductase [Solirubrobacterales bacterium]
MAAIGIAHQRGAEVFATASPSKWDALRELGVAEDHIASSRDTEFEEKFLAVTEGKGVDVVLNALTGEFVDASLAVLGGEGRFLEIGKTDIRDKAELARTHPGVTYIPFDLSEAGPERIGEMLAEVTELFERGELRHSPIRNWDMRQAPEAFRHLREGRNVGKVVLSAPRSLDPERTVLITGATGGLGALIAGHLVQGHGARHLLLVSRSGEEAPGALDLRARLAEQGAEVTIAACDVSDRSEVEQLLAGIDPEHPLGAVIHCAAVLDDATVQGAAPEQVKRVFAPKAGGARHLHELTAGAELTHFVCFSSIAGLFGGPGQGAYAAANRYLDALAQQRRAEGLPATSIAWGLWQRETAMTGGMAGADAARISRGGIAPLSDERGLALFDRALSSGESLGAALALDRAALRERAKRGALPALLAAIAPQGKAPASGGRGAFARRLREAPRAARSELAEDFVRAEVAAVLGHEDAGAVDPGTAFKELGFDSLAAVELRNRLKGATGLRLASTVVFDYPSVSALAAHLLEQVGDAPAPAKRTRARHRVSGEPIAIVGMACRLPGGVSTPQALWELVRSGRDAIAPFPTDRGWDLERLYHPDPDHPGTSYAREGGFLADVAGFDAEFFGIAPREATAMDPQQRLLLETSWETLEDAGISPAALRGEPAGVFVGAAAGSYRPQADGYLMLGGAGSVIAGRVSYALGLEGPAMTVDTACSSSLVAMHLAAGALRNGECALALAGGVTVHANPSTHIDSSRQRALSPDGRCKSFAEVADGTGWSEGAGMLVLERLSDAEANGHRVLATIRGSAVNQDGASNGLSAPNGPAQERVIRQALADAGLAPAEVDMVEAHGTGTPLGDPIEAGAIIATYGQERERPLMLGSLKSNIGHTLAAAGVSGVIKSVLAMREGLMPKTLHAEQPSTRIEWEAGRVELLSEAREWETDGRPRRAAVSSFGISGTNAHLILEQGPPVDAGSGAGEGEGAGPLGGVVALPLSAKTEAALAAQGERLASHLREHPDLDLADVAYSLASGRPAFAHRAAVGPASREEALSALDALAQGGPGPSSLVRGGEGQQAKVAFVFPGQGSQWQGMALELLESSPVFAEAMEECEAALAPHLDFVLRDVLAGRGGAPSIERIEVVQPALFAVMVSLARLWRACGVEPGAVVGHSQGEVAAAHVAGGLSLEDAAHLAAVRGRLISKIAGKGGLVSLIASRERAEELIEPWREEIELAAFNGPSAMILSGTQEALDGLLARCDEDGVRARGVAATVASHSRHVEGLREDVLDAFAEIAPRSGEIPFHSTVTGGPLDTAELGVEYWYGNLRRPVLFEQVTRGLLDAGYGTFVEVSPHPVFALAMRETVEAAASPAAATVLETLRRDEGGPQRFAISLAGAYAAGAPVDWDAFYAGSAAASVPLPTYPFQRKRYWVAPGSAGADPTALGQSALDHPFLAAAIEEPEGGGIAFSGRISLAESPWLADHAVLGTAILPGTAFLELALTAGRRADAPVVEELTLQAPLVLSEERAVQLRVSLSAPDERGRRDVSIHSRPDGDDEQWTRNATGSLSAATLALPERLPQWPPRGAEEIAIEDLRARIEEAGIEYGEAFAGLAAAWRSGNEIYAELALPESAQGAEGFALHPALLDAALHPAALDAGAEIELPFAWSGVSLGGDGARELRARLSLGEGDGLALELFDAVGEPLGQVGSVVVRPLDPERIQGAAELPLLVPRWRQAAGAPTELTAAEVWRLPRPAPGVGAARETTVAALEKIQAWLAAGEEGARLAILTEGAVAAATGETPDPAAAA